MPAFETADLQQNAVIWLSVGQDRYGSPVLSQPQEIKCRWLVDLGQSADPQSNTVQGTGKLIVSLTEHQVPNGSIIREGKICDISTPVNKLFIVTLVDGIPDLKNRNQRTTLTVMRYSDILPTVVTTNAH